MIRGSAQRDGASGPRESSIADPGVHDTLRRALGAPALARLLDDFGAHARQAVRTVTDAKTDPLGPEVGKCAHDLKATAGGFGFPALAACAAAIEQAVREHRVDVARAAAQDLPMIVEETLQALERVRADLDGAS